MENWEERLNRLLKSSEWTTEEKLWLLDYIENSEGTELRQLMQRLFADDLQSAKSIDPEVSGRLLKNIHEKLGIGREVKTDKTRVVRMLWMRIAAASVIIGLLSLSAYLYFNRAPQQQIVAEKTQPDEPVQQNDVAPGHDGAILTLDNGTQIVLDSANNGTLAKQGNLQVLKKGGQIIYDGQDAGSSVVMYNTMTTQRGRQYQLVLADGSKVWLNAASSIRFPTAFPGKERKVEITGEVYFEVAPLSPGAGQKIPFIVKINTASGDGGEVEVVGTHFNVNAYDDETIVKTTLLEGRVKVKKGNAASFLEPGQQAQLTKNGDLKLISNADVEAAVAWKNGRFLFNGSGLKAIMNQIMRWYDVEVLYEGNIPERIFTADISRNTNLSEFLKVLEESKIHFRIEGKKLTVMP